MTYLLVAFGVYVVTVHLSVVLLRFENDRLRRQLIRMTHRPPEW